MNLYDALSILEIDPNPYLAKLKMASIPERLQLANEALESVRRNYKYLLAKNHPDKGGDASRFNLIQSAYAFLESDTSQFITKVEAKINEKQAKSESQVFIKLG